jgi:hypothetical protein
VIATLEVERTRPRDIPWAERQIEAQLKQPVIYGRNGLRRWVARLGGAACVVDAFGNKFRPLGKGWDDLQAAADLWRRLKETHKDSAILSQGIYYRWNASDRRFIEVDHVIIKDARR